VKLIFQLRIKWKTSVIGKIWLEAFEVSKLGQLVYCCKHKINYDNFNDWYRKAQKTISIYERNLNISYK